VPNTNLDGRARAPGDIPRSLEVGQFDQLLVDDEILHAAHELPVLGLEAAHRGVPVVAHEERVGGVRGLRTDPHSRLGRHFVHGQRHQRLSLDDCKTIN